MIQRVSLVFAALLIAWPALAQLTGQAAFGRVRSLLLPREESFAANGVDTGTGAFTMEIPVMQLEGARQISFQLRYHSLLTQASGSISPGWSHNFEAFITPAAAGPVGGAPLRVNIDSGRRLSFPLVNGAYVGEARAARYDKLENRPGNSGWQYTRRDGTRLLFDAQGRLTEEQNKVRQRLTLSYTGGRLSEIREPLANRALRVGYGSPLGPIQSLTDAAGRIAFFGYDNAGRLTSVHPPAQLTPEPILSQVDTLIPDNNQNGVTLPVTISGRGPVGIVRFFGGLFSHSRPADLRVSVISPQGTTVNVTFSNAEAPANLSGRAFEEFWGEDPNGTWRIVVRDVVAGSSGSMNPVSLRFTDLTTPTRFQYGVGGRLTGVFDAGGIRMLSNVYDGMGRLVEQDDGNGQNLTARLQYTESDAGVLTTYRDRLGHEWEYRHNTRYDLTDLTDPLNHTTRFTYTETSDRLSVTDALSRTTQFQYDASGNLTTVTDPLNGVWTFSYGSDGNLTRSRDPLGAETRYEYDNNNNLRRVIDALNHADTKSYNANSQLTGSLMQDGGGINFTYQGGKPVGVAHAVTGANSGAVYDEVGLPSSLKDADGFETKFVYDAQGREIRKTNPLGDSEEFEYDVRGRLVRYRDFAGHVTQYAYDGNDNLIEITDALGRTVRYRYDGEDRLIGTIAPNGQEGRIVYDEAGRVIEEQDPLGNTRSYTYDAVGNRTAEYDSNGKLIVKTTYNALDLPVTQEDADGNRVEITYDAMGQPTRVVNPAGAELATTYDVIGRPVSVKDALGREASRQYAEDDVVRRLVDAKGVTALTFFYDDANRQTSVETRTGFHNWQYNNRDLVTRYTTPTGQQLNYTYDGAGRVTAISPAGTGAAMASTLRYTYDKNGNTLTVREEGGGQSTRTATRTYDALGRVTRYVDSEGNALEYAYDVSGNLSSIRYPDGKQVFYTYDTANRLEEVRDWSGRRTRYYYDANSRITRIRYPNGAVRVLSYDARGRVLRRQDRSGSGELIVDYRYSYDPAGSIGVETPGFSGTGYSPAPSSFTYNSQNQIQTFNGQGVTYDQNGRMTNGPLGTETGGFQYSFRGNLTAAGNLTLLYNSEDRLTGYQQGGQTTRLVVNPIEGLSQVLVKRDPSGSSTYYVWGVGLAYEVNSSDQVRVYHYDQRGSVAAFTNTAGQVSGRVSYGPYGEVVARSGETDSLYLFQGLFGIATVPNGLNLMGARWYSPFSKSFLTEDPYFGEIERPGSLNRYAYAGADPINRFDPSGKFWNLIGAAIGAVVNVAVQAVSDVIAGEFSGWEAYAGAAIGGAVAGFIVSSTGCIACAGAAGAASEYLVTKGLKGEQVNAVELALVTGVGAVSAKVGDKVGKVLGAAGQRAGKAMGKAFAKNAARPVAQRFNRHALKKALQREATKQRWRDLLGTIPEDFGVGLAEEIVVRPGVVQAVLNPQSAPQAQASKPTITEATAEGVRHLNRNRVQAYGEFIHWNYFIEALQLAAAPVPNNPNNLLTSF